MDVARIIWRPNLQTAEYYIRAMDYFRRHKNKPLFCVFSDDLLWAKKTFQLYNDVIYVNENRTLSDVQELQVMRKCMSAIISNSSFSWWGAWLIKNPDKTVITPIKWQNKEDMMPSTWLRM